MRKEGHITVFLSLILVCVCSLVCGLLESARTAGASCHLQVAAGSAMDSLLSQYHRPLWKSYRLLLLEHEDARELEEELVGFLKAYTETENWYPMWGEDAKVKSLRLATDDHGKYLEQEILDYMKLGIWDLDLDPSHGEALLKNLKEAEAVKDIGKAYGSHGKQAVKLEQALAAIQASLKSQTQHYQRGMGQLGRGDGPGFRGTASDLARELERIPGLVAAYEKQADLLDRELKASREEFREKQGDLSPSVLEALGQEIQHYQDYVEEDGKRRQEVAGQVPRAAQNRRALEDAREAAREAEEMILDWEDSGQDGEDLDQAALWDKVAQVFARCQIPSLSCTAGVKDQEKQKLLEQVEKIVDLGLLSLVLPEGAQVSEGVLDQGEFPSQAYGGEGGGTDGGLIARLLTDEYCMQFFTHFLSEDKKEVQYEVEYLVGGKDTDRGNLKAAAARILTVREGMNFIHILLDSEKRREARALAALIAGGTGLVFLVAVVAFFIMAIWALGEAVADVRNLLKGEKVPLFKTRESWNLSLDGLLDLGKDGSCPEGKEEKAGIGYGGYLSMLLFLKNPEEKYYQMMDVMQMNIRRDQEDFLMSRCAYQVEMDVGAIGRHLFFAIGIPGLERWGQGLDYPMNVTVEKAY